MEYEFTPPADRRPMLLLAILAAAAVARLWNLGAGVPFAVGIDEPQVVDRAIRILRTSDWNTHLFDYPTLVIYLDAVAEVPRFLWGAMRGEWTSLDGFRTAAVYSTARLVAATIGIATVWLTYRLGAALARRDVGLIAAAQLAVQPSHVRESHFALTDVPAAALTTAAVLMAVRAARTRTVRAYAMAGALCGLAAAAKYVGGVSLIAVATAWMIADRAAADRWRKALAAAGAAAAAFLAGAPYTLLDLPNFLDGFARQFARFAVPRSTEPAGLIYLKHLSLVMWWWPPLAAAGAVAVLARRRSRAAWLPLIVFSSAYFYLLATHWPVFARYALPLLPMLCLLSSVAVLDGFAAIRRVLPHIDRRVLGSAEAIIVVLLLLWAPAAASVNWLNQSKRSDTREIAARWLEAAAPPQSRVAVENSGPTYLADGGFRVIGTELLIDHSPDWYLTRADYLIVSSPDASRYAPYLAEGRTVFQVSPAADRWGPPITIVKLRAPGEARP